MSVFLLGLRDDMLSEADVERLKGALPENMSLLFTVDYETFAPHAEKIEVAAGWFRSKWIREMAQVKWVHQWGAGTDWLLEYPDLIEKSFILTNSVGVSAIPMSEHILGMMLHHSRNFRNALAAQREKHWAKLFHPTEDHHAHPRNLSWEDMAELAGQTVLLVGVGAIGQRVARLAKAFEMSVIGVRNNPAKGDPNVDQMVGVDQ
ncbi:MAG: NAD(P)-dependent oxidoreductase, partial [Chloroflexota bacterium]